MCLDSRWASVQVLVCKATHFVGFCSSWLDVFPPKEVLCQLYSRVLCAGNFLKGLVVEGVAVGNRVPFLGHSQLVTFLYVKAHEPPPFPGLQSSEAVL